MSYACQAMQIGKEKKNEDKNGKKKGSWKSENFQESGVKYDKTCNLILDFVMNITGNSLSAKKGYKVTKIANWSFN